MATGCQVDVQPYGQVFDLRQNKALGATASFPDGSHLIALYIRSTVGDEVANIVLSKFGSIDYEWGIKSASTDFVRLYPQSKSMLNTRKFAGKRYLRCDSPNRRRVIV